MKTQLQDDLVKDVERNAVIWNSLSGDFADLLIQSDVPDVVISRVCL